MSTTENQSRERDSSGVCICRGDFSSLGGGGGGECDDRIVLENTDAAAVSFSFPKLLSTSLRLPSPQSKQTLVESEE